MCVEVADELWKELVYEHAPADRQKFAKTSGKSCQRKPRALKMIGFEEIASFSDKWKPYTQVHVTHKQGPSFKINQTINISWKTSTREKTNRKHATIKSEDFVCRALKCVHVTRSRKQSVSYHWKIVSSVSSYNPFLRSCTIFHSLRGRKIIRVSLKFWFITVSTPSFKAAQLLR